MSNDDPHNEPAHVQLRLTVPMMRAILAHMEALAALTGRVEHAAPSFIGQMIDAASDNMGLSFRLWPGNDHAMIFRTALTLACKDDWHEPSLIRAMQRRVRELDIAKALAEGKSVIDLMSEIKT